MGLTSEKCAKSFMCPLARTHEVKERAGCDGAKCILWRWGSISANDHRFRRAVSQAQTEMCEAAQALENKKDKPRQRQVDSFHKAAVLKISTAPHDYISMTEDDRGYCGLGGKP
jgi:hypothetical protein